MQTKREIPVMSPRISFPFFLLLWTFQTPCHVEFAFYKQRAQYIWKEEELFSGGQDSMKKPSQTRWALSLLDKEIILRLGEHVRKGRNCELCINMHTHTLPEATLKWGNSPEKWRCVASLGKSEDWRSEPHCPGLISWWKQCFLLCEGLLSPVSTNPTTPHSLLHGGWEVSCPLPSCSSTPALTWGHLTPQHHSRASHDTENWW